MSDHRGSIENARCRPAIATPLLTFSLSLSLSRRARDLCDLGENTWRKRGRIVTDYKFVTTMERRHATLPRSWRLHRLCRFHLSASILKILFGVRRAEQQPRSSDLRFTRFAFSNEAISILTLSLSLSFHLRPSVSNTDDFNIPIQQTIFHIPTYDSRVCASPFSRYCRCIIRILTYCLCCVVRAE